MKSNRVYIYKRLQYFALHRQCRDSGKQ